MSIKKILYFKYVLIVLLYLDIVSHCFWIYLTQYQSLLFDYDFKILFTTCHRVSLFININSIIGTRS